MTEGLKLSIRAYEEGDFEAAYAVINDAAMSFRETIPADRWHEPYMPGEELSSEIAAGVRFSCALMEGRIVGVMGLQRKDDVDLIRHAYVVPAYQSHGAGAMLLKHVTALSERPILLGTWRANVRAIAFYARHGYQLVGEDHRERLLRTYWSIPERQIEESIVMADERWIGLHAAGR
ncbi:MAG: GNAT family N-acetyltransferase [Dehalococcoidia bacterium]|nr:GNAT family N-acetyltransferase [Dehalococcoidia bacterium]